MKQKRKVVKRTSTPDAFNRKWKPIERSRIQNAISAIRPTQNYEMGGLHISYSPQVASMPAILIVSHSSRNPTWDEMVWIRYQICPNIEDMAMILPPLDEYINYTGGRGKFTFTMESVKRGV